MTSALTCWISRIRCSWRNWISFA